MLTSDSTPTKEPQYSHYHDLAKCHPGKLGLMTNQVWYDDPRRLGFVLARYKFVAKMFAGMSRVLEVGCGDAFCSRIVQQEVKFLHATDFDPVLIEEAKERIDSDWPMELSVHDMSVSPMPELFDGVFALDVLEHIPTKLEDVFVSNLAASLKPHGSLIIGTPSLESQAYASEGSKVGHVNCKSGDELRNLLGHKFHHVFMFCMNDEVLHIGFQKMAHYLFALCCEKIE